LINREHMSHKNFINTLIFGFVLIFLSSCYSLKDIKYMNKNIYLDKLESIDPSFKKNDILLYVDIDKQSMIHLNKGKIQNVYPISSSSYGTGSKENSFKTPLGKHEIYKKIGYNLPENAILKGRVWNGAIADIIKEPIDTDFDHVTSRILWLDGLEIGKNKGKGIDSRNRFIYIHGTAEEGLIGKPASDGCIRMYNSDVIKLFDLVDEKAQVWIY
tara:strand:- start:1 stop:645 length:645 start_codon:yes stop_codon:yes gene_type:complete